MSETVVIVGAGTAGCVAAARLSEDPERQVVLLEAGEDRGGEAPLTSLNWMDSLTHREAFYPDLFATKTVGAAPKLYNRGRGVGGSASTNAMLAIPGLPFDYDNYAETYGVERWSWEQVAPWLEDIKGKLTRSSEEELSPVDRALLRSGSVLGVEDYVDMYTPQDGSAIFYRTADKTARQSSRELWLEPARSRDNLEIRPNSQVDRLIIEDGRAVGVILADGSEVRADTVILCAGVFETPAILLRSGLDNPGIGKGLQDHPAISIYFSMKPEHRDTRPKLPCIGSVMRFSSTVGNGDLHLLPLHGELLQSDPPAHGLLMAAVMRTRSFGSLKLNPDNPLSPPQVDLRMLEHPIDKQAMREAVDAAVRVLKGPAFQEIVEQIFIDEHGTPPEALEDPQVYEEWLANYIGDYFHSVGTTRMGLADDPMAVVDQQGRVYGTEGLAVWDASILPEVPSANTHIPVTLIAERLSAAYRTGEFV